LHVISRNFRGSAVGAGIIVADRSTTLPARAASTAAAGEPASSIVVASAVEALSSVRRRSEEANDSCGRRQRGPPPPASNPSSASSHPHDPLRSSDRPGATENSPDAISANVEHAIGRHRIIGIGIDPLLLGQLIRRR